MLLSAILHGAPIILISVMIQPFLTALGPLSSPPTLEAPFTALLEQSTVWMQVISWLGPVAGVVTIIISLTTQYVDVIAMTPKDQKPVTVHDHFALAAEHDPVISFANHVLQSVDRAIANQWPSKPKNR